MTIHTNNTLKCNYPSGCTNTLPEQPTEGSAFLVARDHDWTHCHWCSRDFCARHSFALSKTHGGGCNGTMPADYQGNDVGFTPKEYDIRHADGSRPLPQLSGQVSLLSKEDVPEIRRTLALDDDLLPATSEEE